MRQWLGWMTGFPANGYVIVRAWTKRGARKKVAAAVEAGDLTVEVRRLTPAMKWAHDRNVAVLIPCKMERLALRRHVPKRPATPPARKWSSGGLFLLLAALALPAAAQPYDTAGEALFALGCREACIRPGFGALTCGTFRPSVPANPNTREGWKDRYGVEWGSRGDHSAGAGVVAEFARRADNPLKLRQPYTWTALDATDAAIVGAPGGTPCHQVVQQRFGAACPPSWACDSLPPDLAARCLADPPTLACRGFSFLPHLCHLLQSSGKLSYNRDRPECTPTATGPPPPPPPPPPPEPRCGDGKLDSGETCVTCREDQPAGACGPESPVEPPTDREALIERILEAIRKVLDEEVPHG